MQPLPTPGEDTVTRKNEELLSTFSSHGAIRRFCSQECLYDGQVEHCHRIPTRSAFNKATGSPQGGSCMNTAAQTAGAQLRFQKHVENTAVTTARDRKLG